MMIGMTVIQQDSDEIMVRSRAGGRSATIIGKDSPEKILRLGSENGATANWGQKLRFLVSVVCCSRWLLTVTDFFIMIDGREACG